MLLSQCLFLYVVYDIGMVDQNLFPISFYFTRLSTAFDVKYLCAMIVLSSAGSMPLSFKYYIIITYLKNIAILTVAIITSDLYCTT